MPTSRFLSQQGGRFARRSYPARLIGLALGFLAVGAVFQEIHAPIWLWVSLVIYSFIWPHIAYFWASNIRDSFITGQRQMLFDSFCGGLWAVAMGFNLVPTVVVLTMLAMNNMASGGIRLFIIGLAVKLLSIGLFSALLGVDLYLESSLRVMLASFPFLVIHPLAVGAMTFQFALSLHTQKNRLRKLSRTDGLTGLYNRRYWQSRALEEFNRCHRKIHSALLIMADIDHFKAINDTYGHTTGDDVIHRVAEIMQRQLRNIDLIGRFGGEEFAIVLPDSDMATGKEVAERLRLSVANDLEDENIPVTATLSLGIAEFSHDFDSFEDWVNAADEALYEAKDRGRNCFCCYSPNKTLRVVSSNPGKDSSKSQSNQQPS
ncbi:putative diguanylate cyclase AdrA [Thalassocella blandensis]|nr:putative diguanylate cyclase AdrA [Thalassocella blandensis]